MLYIYIYITQYIYIYSEYVYGFPKTILSSTIQNRHVVPHSWIFVSKLAVRWITNQLPHCTSFEFRLPKESHNLVIWNEGNTCNVFGVGWSWLRGRESEVPSEDKPSGQLMIISMHLGTSVRALTHTITQTAWRELCDLNREIPAMSFGVGWSWLRGRESEVPFWR